MRRATVTEPQALAVEPGIVCALIPFDLTGRFLATSADNLLALHQFGMTGEQDVMITDEGDGSYLGLLPIAQDDRGPIDPVADAVTLHGSWSAAGIHIG